MPKISRFLTRLPALASMSIFIGCTPANQEDTVPDAPPEQFIFLDEDSRYTVKSNDSCQPSKASRPDGYQNVYYSNLWQRIRDQFKWNRELDRPEVQAQIAAFKSRPESIQRISEQASPYLFFITSQINELNAPMELALLPIIESSYNPFAYSGAKAAGMWQFMPRTGSSYGLKQDWWYDGRRDIVSSTNAALVYFKELSERYDGDWPLALAAYNSGMGTVDRAIKKNRAAGKPTDYWSLSLPKETMHYVPKLLALAEIFSHPRRYNITLSPVENDAFFVTVDVGSQIDIAKAAKMAKMKPQELRQLNPGHSRWATDPHGRHELLIPVTNAETFQYALAKLPPSKRLSQDRYRVKTGDSLGIIAQRHRTTVNALRTINHIDGNLIRVGQSLVVPLIDGAPTLSSARTVDLRTKKSSGNYHTVRSGDSLWSIAKRYRVNAKQLARWNQIESADTLSIGQRLIVLATQAPTPKRLGYKVKNGDSLARISSQFNINITDIVRWNALNKKAYIRPGQQLTLYIN